MELEPMSENSFQGYRGVAPRIRINNLGVLTVNATAVLAAGWQNVVAVVPKYDSNQQIIALEAADAETPNAVRFRDHNFTKTCNLSKFLDSYGIKPSGRSISMPCAYNTDLDILTANYSERQESTRPGRPKGSKNKATLAEEAAISAEVTG